MAPNINFLTSLNKITRRLILQQARYHSINKALPDCKQTVSESISLSFSLFFSPFHHCTRSLSVTDWYLALPHGRGGFRQGFTCPAYSGTYQEAVCFRTTRLSRSKAQLSSCIQLTNNFVTLWIFCEISEISPTTPSIQRSQAIHAWRV